MKITTTSNADLPLKHGQKALLTCDGGARLLRRLRNARPKYVETFLNSLANWDFAAANLKG
ncbi:MAG: Fe-Mn family superoxide dismutase [Polyangiaceae bacterium]